MSFDFLDQANQQRKQAKLFRQRVCVSSNKDAIVQIEDQHYINFASNDYLGLSQHPAVLQAFAEGLSIYGAGSGASSVVTGYSAEHKALEEDICIAVNKPAALLFGSGFSANHAICTALFDKKYNSSGDILCDKLMHASFIQGALDSSASLYRFKHNDLAHAAQLFSKLGKNSLIATEGVFSMDGDKGNIQGLYDLIRQGIQDTSGRPWLMSDEAHSFGVLGEHGFGSESLSCVDLVMGTFGKAVGTGGAFVAGSKSLIDFLVNYSKHYVYSTAFSAAKARSTRAALALVEQGKEREQLHANIALFKTLIASAGLEFLNSDSAIQILVLGDPDLTIRASARLAKLGIWVGAIRTPTVPKNSDRLRITLSALHSEQDIRALVDSLCLVREELNWSSK